MYLPLTICCSNLCCCFFFFFFFVFFFVFVFCFCQKRLNHDIPKNQVKWSYFRPPPPPFFISARFINPSLSNPKHILSSTLISTPSPPPPCPREVPEFDSHQSPMWPCENLGTVPELEYKISTLYSSTKVGTGLVLMFMRLSSVPGRFYPEITVFEYPPFPATFAFKRASNRAKWTKVFSSVIRTTPVRRQVWTQPYISMYVLRNWCYVQTVFPCQKRFLLKSFCLLVTDHLKRWGVGILKLHEFDSFKIFMHECFWAKL